MYKDAIHVVVSAVAAKASFRDPWYFLKGHSISIYEGGLKCGQPPGRYTPGSGLYQHIGQKHLLT